MKGFDGTVPDPRNKDAAKVFTKGVKVEERVHGDIVHLTGPPPMRLPPDGTGAFTGKRIGRMTVVGYALEANRWVVRCDCGDYELRSNKFVASPHPGDRCNLCMNLARAKRQEYFRRTGQWKETSEF